MSEDLYSWVRRNLVEKARVLIWCERCQEEGSVPEGAPLRCPICGADSDEL